MINLAGRVDCDMYIRDELTRARIPIVEAQEPSTDEVPSRVSGKLGAFTFRRAWYYWIVSGPLPIGAARALYADPEGRRTVRASGHGCGIDPDDCVQWFDTEGKLLAIDKTGKEAARYRDLCERHGWDADDVRYVQSLDEVPDRRGIVDCYHIDNQAGLRLFADTLVGFHLDE
jgi:hypothetical protein